VAVVIVREAYAKLNLYLEITGRRSDGYHALRMLNQSISLCDKLTLAPGTGGITLSCDAPEIPTDERNLVIKAAKLFLERAHLSLPADGLHFILEKRIPSQAGMGGGSSDAAAALLILNERFDFPLSSGDLYSLAADLGADVPFSLQGGSAVVEGKGEQLFPLPKLTKGAFLLVKPALGISTKEAFALYDKNPILSDGRFAEAKNAFANSDLTALGNLLFNHFEVLSPLPIFEQIRQALCDAGALGSALSGSGSTVFGLFPDLKSATKARAVLAKDKTLVPHLAFLAVAKPCAGKSHGEIESL